jgi:hypothetical protein
MIGKLLGKSVHGVRKLLKILETFTRMGRERELLEGVLEMGDGEFAWRAAYMQKNIVPFTRSQTSISLMVLE